MRFHCDRVAVLASELGMAWGLSEEELSTLRISASFHDIGKMGIPDHILLKPAPLNDEEWELMKTYAEQGERIFRATNIPNAGTVAAVICHHHENFDGNGYPDGLRRVGSVPNWWHPAEALLAVG